MGRFCGVCREVLEVFQDRPFGFLSQLEFRTSLDGLDDFLRFVLMSAARSRRQETVKHGMLTRFCCHFWSHPGSGRAGAASGRSERSERSDAGNPDEVRLQMFIPSDMLAHFDSCSLEVSSLTRFPFFC